MRKRNEYDILAEIAAADKPKRPQRPRYCPDDLWQLMEACWSYRPEDRPTVSQVCGKL